MTSDRIGQIARDAQIPVVTCAQVLSDTTSKLAQEHVQRTMFSTAGGVVVLLATLAGLISVTAHLVTPAVGPAVYAAWTLAFLVAATIRTERTGI